MKVITGWQAAVLALVCAAAGSAKAAAVQVPAPQAQIPFANHHGIYDWHVINDRTLLIQSEGGTWYKATLMSPCFNLPFAERIGFKSNPDGSFDRFSAIQVRDQRCPLTSLVVTTAPGAKHKPKQKPKPPKHS